MKPNIKLTGNITGDVAIAGRDLNVIADTGASLSGTPNTTTIATTGISHLTISDLAVQSTASAITSCIGTSDSADSSFVLIRTRVSNCSNGVVGNRVTIRDSSVIASKGIGVSGNLVMMSGSIVANNTGGGVSMGDGSSIVNSIIVGNGNTTFQFDGGGVTIATGATATISFTTIANNLVFSGPNAGAGIACSVLAGSNNIISGNALSPNCTLNYSLFDTGTTSGGAHNKTGDPSFKNVDVASPLNPDFFRIGAASDAIDSADPASTITVDIDGIARPQGAGFDMGASELKP